MGSSFDGELVTYSLQAGSLGYAQDFTATGC